MNFMWFSSLFKINWLTSELFKKKKRFFLGSPKGQRFSRRVVIPFLLSLVLLLAPCSTDLIQSEFGSLCLSQPCLLSRGNAVHTPGILESLLQGTPWPPPCSPSMGPFLCSWFWASGMHSVMVIDCSQWSSLPPLPQPHLPSGFPFPLNGTHCLPTVFHFLFLLPPLLPLCAFDGTPYPFCLLPSPCSQPGSGSLSHVTTSWFEFHFADLFQMCLSLLHFQIYPSRAGVWMCHPPGFICRKWGNPWTGMRLCRKMT